MEDGGGGRRRWRLMADGGKFLAYLQPLDEINGLLGECS